MKIPSPFPLSTTFVACYELYAGFGGGIAHRGHNRPQRFHLEAFFENEPRA
jgi:hypothetical protein